MGIPAIRWDRRARRTMRTSFGATAAKTTRRITAGGDCRELNSFFDTLRGFEKSV